MLLFAHSIYNVYTILTPMLSMGSTFILDYASICVYSATTIGIA